MLNTGDKILAIGLGTWQSGGDLCIEAVKIALKVGYLYGNEVEVDKALAEAFKGGLMRENLFLTSKLCFATNSHKRVANSIRVSLESLGVSYLDLYLVHWPESSAMGDATDPPWKSGNEYKQFLHRLKPTWNAMESLMETGLVRAIGVSNLSIQQISELLQFASIAPAVNQMELHPFWRQDELVKFCQQNDSGSEDELGIPRITFRRSRSVHGPMLKLSIVAEIAEQHKMTPEQKSKNELCGDLVSMAKSETNKAAFTSSESSRRPPVGARGNASASCIITKVGPLPPLC